MGRRRERSDIILDILSVIQSKGGKIKPTHLMYKANLSHNQMRAYLSELIQKGLVETLQEENHEYITITQPGLKFLMQMRQMKEFEKTFGL
ncbi:hypothetical protein DRJ48_02935 [Candidatus Woesearchaeota archaeon]|nr:MAG: hypothetical protein DRJ48_02935 [Candidatus Woesearchaeota archaeon]